MPSDPAVARSAPSRGGDGFKVHVLLLTADAVDRAAAAVHALRAAPEAGIEIVGVGGNSHDATTDAFRQWDVPLVESGRAAWWAQSLERALGGTLERAGPGDALMLLNDRARIAGPDLMAAARAASGAPAVVGGSLADHRSGRRIIAGDAAMLDLVCIAVALAGSFRPDPRLGAGRHVMPGYGTVIPIALLHELRRTRDSLGAPGRLGSSLASLLARLDGELRIVPHFLVRTELEAFQQMRQVVDVFTRCSHRRPLARTLAVLRQAPGNLKLPLVLRDGLRTLRRQGSRLDRIGDRLARTGKTGDRPRALAHFLLAALLANSNALTNLGLLQLRNGKGHAARRRAMWLLGLSESLGNRFAPYHRGRLLLEGSSSYGSAAKALAALELAAERGFATAEVESRRLRARLVNEGLPRVRLLTIGIPTARRPDKLRRCLESIARQRGLDAERLEIIVADNAPGTGGAPEAVRAFLARTGLSGRCLAEPRPGVGRARNRILRAAGGDVIAFVDDDCLLDERWAEQLVRFFEADPAAAIIGGMVRLHDPADRPLTVKLDPHRARLRAGAGIGGFVHGCNFAMRRIILAEIGAYDGRFGKGALFRAAEDLDVYHRAFRKGWKVIYDPRALVYHGHGRRSDDVEAALWRDYAIGGGAFRMKCMLAGDVAMMGRFALEIATWLCRAPQRRTPGNRRPLSDLGFHLLGAVAFLALAPFASRADDDR